MDCDIHAHVEIKIKGRWEHYSCPLIPRSSLVFERICGVRGEVKNAIAAPRGLPKNLNIVTQMMVDEWDSDGHDHTWLTAKELDGLIDWVEKHIDNMWQHHHLGYLAGNMFASESRPVEIEDVRFICWFDN